MGKSYQRAPPPTTSQTSTCGFLVNLVCGVVFIVCVVVLVTLYLNGEFDSLFGSGNNDFVPDNVTIVEISADNITRAGSAYIGLIFVSQMQSAVETAFDTAAARWSSIVDGTTLNTRTFASGTEFCDAVILSESITLNHIAIIARVRSIDGESGILGQARPCNVQATGSLGFLPIFGLMDFDSADLSGMVQDGTITAVITHEMGHVLGIGTLWRGAIQGHFINSAPSATALLQNPVLNSDGSLSQSTIQPKFIGDFASAAFVAAGGNSGQNGVPVENGRQGNGQLLFNPLTNGAGSIDSHWDEDFMSTELMEFRISASTSHPLSAISIKSLQDLGYTVSTALADSFSVSSGARSATRLRGGKVYTLFNDVPVDYLDLLDWN